MYIVAGIASIFVHIHALIQLAEEAYHPLGSGLSLCSLSYSKKCVASNAGGNSGLENKGVIGPKV